MTYIDWLPTEKACNCPDNAVNCLTKKAWFRNQIPVWWFHEHELKSPFDIESRRSHPAIFPVALAVRVIENYSHPGQTVLDCFSGVGTTMYAAKLCGRNAIGVELNREYSALAEKRVETLTVAKAPSAHTHQHQINDDARKLLKYIPESTIDMIFCSPPYWDLLKQKPSDRNLKKQQYLKDNYSDSSQDLSNERELDGFVQALRDIISKAALTLKNGGRFIINTGDYRRRGKFIPLHEIYIQLLTDLELELRNIIIWDRRKEYDTSLFSYPYNFIVNNGMFEYILEFRK